MRIHSDFFLLIGFKQLVKDPAFCRPLLGNFIQDAEPPKTSQPCSEDFYATRRMWKLNPSNEEKMNLANQLPLLAEIRRFLRDSKKFRHNDIGTDTKL